MPEYLKISIGESATVKLLGPPEETMGKWGTNYNFPIEHGGKEMVWTATERASTELQKGFAPGDRIRIENKPREGGGSVYLFHKHTMDQGTTEGEDRLTGLARYLKGEFAGINEKLDELLRLHQ